MFSFLLSKEDKLLKKLSEQHAKLTKELKVEGSTPQITKLKNEKLRITIEELELLHSKLRQAKIKTQTQLHNCASYANKLNYNSPGIVVIGDYYVTDRPFKAKIKYENHKHLAPFLKKVVEKKAKQELNKELNKLSERLNGVEVTRKDIDLYRYLEFMSTRQEINIANLDYNLDTVKAMASHFKTDIVLGWA
mgnify:FL=1